MNLATIALLKSLLGDIGSKDAELLDAAEDALNSKAFVALLTEAGCPLKYINAMRDTLPLSWQERAHCCKAIRTYLSREAKKNPA